MLRTVAPLLVLTPLAAPQAAAQENRADILVTGRGLDDRPGDAALAIVTIDRDRVAASASGRLESVLADVAGLQQFRRSDSRSAHPTSQGITLRGLGGNAASRALLLLDGVPQADPFGGWVAFPAYATDRIGRIRVTRGGGSGYAGAGALAGTIEIDTAAPGSNTPFTAMIAGGSRESLDARGSAALVRDGGFATMSAAWAQGDGFVPVVAGDRGPADRPAPYRQGSVALRGVIAIAPATELQANVSGFTDRRERGTAFTAIHSEGVDASLRLVRRGDWGWSAVGWLQTRNVASSFAGVNAARTIATQTLDQYRTPATGWGGRLEVAPPVGDAIVLRMGGDVRGVSGRTQERYSFVAGAPTRGRVAGGRNLSAGLFVDGSAERGPFTLTLGGRIDAWRIDAGSLRERVLATGLPLTDLAFATRSGHAATGRAGLAWQADPAITLRAAAYRGWRLPTLNELYRPFRAGADATAPDPMLAPETLDGIEGGVTLTPAPALRLNATVFANRLEDAIANVTAGRGPANFPLVGFVAAAGTYRVRRNIDRVDSRGLEIDAAWRPGPIGLSASWSHVSARIRADGTAAPLDGLRPAQTPRDQLSTTLDWQHRTGLTASATLRHVGRQFEDDQNVRTLSPATTLDGYAALPITRALRVELRAENLSDARVEAAVSATGTIERAIPRTIWIGLRYGG